MAKFTRLPDGIEERNYELKQLRMWMSYFTAKDASATAGSLPNMGGEWKSTPADDSTKRFINLEQTFLKEFEKYNRYFPGLSDIPPRRR